MPLTTPPSVLPQYSDDQDHFLHVLDHLFRPAIVGAGYDLVKPIMRGADLIHAEIIKNLEQAELVLCDVSLLNPNVFFELGIRTALDRPVALIKDDRTTSYPFDTTMINYHSYDSRLAPWSLQAEIQALQDHITATAQRASGRNSLWQYFGLTQRAQPAEIENPVEGKLDLVLRELSALRSSAVSPVEAPRWPSDVWLTEEGLLDGSQTEGLTDELVEALISAVQIADELNANLYVVSHGDRSAELGLGRFKLDDDCRTRIEQTAAAVGVTLTISRA
jgi:hypothetical protein